MKKGIRHYGYQLVDEVLHHGVIRKEIARQRELTKIMSENSERAYAQTKDLLGSMLQKVAEKVPFYKGIDYHSLSNFPVITKELVREDYNKFQNPDYNLEKLRKYHTSGSTGTPFYVVYAPAKLLANRASLLIDYMQHGYSLGDPLYYFRAWTDINRYSKLKTLATNFIMQDASGTTKNVDQFISGLKKNSYILSYVSAIMSYARNIKERALEERVRGKVGAIICIWRETFRQ